MVLVLTMKMLTLKTVRSPNLTLTLNKLRLNHMIPDPSKDVETEQPPHTEPSGREGKGKGKEGASKGKEGKEDGGKDKGKSKGERDKAEQDKGERDTGEQDKGEGDKDKGEGDKGKGDKRKRKKKPKPTPRIEDIVSDEGEPNKGERHRLPPRPSTNQPRQGPREFDLPVVTIPPPPKTLVPHIHVVPKDNTIESGVQVKLFRASPATAPLEYEFRAWEQTVSQSPLYVHTSNVSVQKAKIEHELLRRTMEIVERNYKDNLPPHHLPEAQKITFSNQCSRIFVTNPKKLHKLTPTQVQDIFRHRHILIVGLESPNSRFDREALSRLGSLTALRCIQGMCRP